MKAERYLALFVLLLLISSLMFITRKEVVDLPASAFFADYQRHIQSLRSLKSADSIVLHEGLPHQTYEKEYKTELEKQTYQEIHDYPFYVETLALETNDLTRLKTIFGSEKTFLPATGAGKACGGFHPDYCLEWTVKDAKRCYCLICFGCNEVRFYQGLRKLPCDLGERKVGQELAYILCKYQKNRPMTEHLKKLIDWGNRFSNNSK
jgi:hypothetical protein